LTKKELGIMVYNASHITGDFTLRSGQKSTEYFDKYLFESDPKILAGIAEKISETLPKCDYIAGLELGGVGVATAISLKTGMPQLFVRKTAKEYGTCKLAEGPDFTGKRVLIIEDIVTTGGQQTESANELRKLGADVTDVVCVILRNEKARENLSNIGLKLSELFTMEELNGYVGN
jgi:orotate phosphoribosyltransferase